MALKVLCPSCERLIDLQRFRLEGAALVVTCQRCETVSRVEPTHVPMMPLPPISSPTPARMTLSSQGASNVVVLRTSAHDAVAKAAQAAEANPFAVPDGLCPKCIARKSEGDACPHCGLHFDSADEQVLGPPRWLKDAWVSLLRDWGNESAHQSLRRKAQQGDALAAVGRLYRLRQASTPDDPYSAEGLADVLRMAAMHIAFRPPSGEKEPPGSNPRLVIIGSVFALIAIALITYFMRLR